MSLELYISHNFMGFFVTDDDANYLKRLALQYVKEVSGSSVFRIYFSIILILFSYNFKLTKIMMMASLFIR